MKREFRIINKEGSHEYNIEVSEYSKGKIFRLFYSNSPIWTFPGSLIFEIKDDNRAKNALFPVGI